MGAAMPGPEEPSQRQEVARLLSAWSNHDPTARDALVAIVYGELRRLARHYMQGERAGHTLQTRRSSTRRTSGWRISIGCSGAIARIFSRWPRR